MSNGKDNQFEWSVEFEEDLSEEEAAELAEAVQKAIEDHQTGKERIYKVRFNKRV